MEGYFGMYRGTVFLSYLVPILVCFNVKIKLKTTSMNVHGVIEKSDINSFNCYSAVGYVAFSE